MNKVFDGVSFNGVIKPGETYILYGDHIDWARGLFTIRTDEEALISVHMIMLLICDLGSRLEKYLGIEKLYDDGHDEETYEISLQCRDSFDGELFVQRLTLERLRTFEEQVDYIKERFPMDEAPRSPRS